MTYLKGIFKIRWQYLAILIIGIGIGGYFRYFWSESQVSAKMVTLISRGVQYDVVTHAADVSGLMAEQSLYTEGSTMPDGATPIIHGMHISYAGPIAITLVDGGSEQQLTSAALNVDEFLEEGKIILGKADEISPPREATLYNGMQIVIRRINTAQETIEEPIPFKTLTQGDENALFGSEVIIEEGLLGMAAVTFDVTYENGYEISRMRLSSSVIREPSARVVRLGTKVEVEAYEYGRASWYRYMGCMCAAHPFFPKGSLLGVRFEPTGKSVVVRVNDWGPNQAIHPDRLIDLDAVAFQQLATLGTGTIRVKVEKLKTE